MKRFDLPLWSDTVFVFSAAFLLFFCIFRFYLNGLWAAALCAFAAGGAAGTLFFLFLRARRKKKHTSEGEKAEIGKLAFHLAMDAPENGAKLLAESINAAHEKRGETAPPARAERDAVIAGDARGFVRFRFEKVTADELSPFIRAEGAKKAVFAGAFTEEAKKLAEAFGLELFDADRVYALVKEGGRMPQKLISPPEKRNGAKEKFRFRIRRSAWKGYLLSGGMLLLFSLVTVFPVYYVVSGSVLLTIAVLVRFFGKKE